MQGLSPRVRRYLHGAPTWIQNRRSISACAEVPWFLNPHRPEYKVYLRVCGGTDLWLSLSSVDSGLSPRVRRYPQDVPADEIESGSISACAEVPWGARSGLEAGTVYLRVCGGTSHFASVSSLASGLSPRVRRYPRQRLRKVRGKRSISACAEVPPSRRTYCPLTKVYLRVCGGTVLLMAKRDPEGGLSPRVRRYLRVFSRVPFAERSISACAEVPRHVFIGSLAVRVYLRVCGGTENGKRKKLFGKGLSPRVRRYPLSRRTRLQARGSISACAEVPASGARTCTMKRVYLRVCGGTIMVRGRKRPGTGLSPRVRRYLPR